MLITSRGKPKNLQTFQATKRRQQEKGRLFHPIIVLAPIKVLILTGKIQTTNDKQISPTTLSTPNIQTTQ